MKSYDSKVDTWYDDEYSMFVTCLYVIIFVHKCHGLTLYDILRFKDDIVNDSWCGVILCITI